MTRMEVQKRRLLKEALKDIQALCHLTGNNSQVVNAFEVLKALEV